MATPKAFSTTGRGPQAIDADAEATAAGEAVRAASAAGSGRPAVELQRCAGEAAGVLPEKLRLGGGWPTAATIGRHADNDAVLTLKASSKVHCQVALRSFQLPGVSDQVHEALFLRDVSKNGALVGGVPAFRPWHWLQNGDVIGIRPEASAPGAVDLFKVQYCTYKPLAGHMVSPEEMGVQKDKAPRDVDEALAPPPSTPAASSTARAPATAGRAAAGRAAAPAPAPAAKRRLAKTFGNEICGRIVDVRYEDPPATYRMKVISFDRSHGWHLCDSAGLSVWDGESFTDEVPLNTMFAEGRIKFVDTAVSATEVQDLDSADEAPAAKRARKGGAVESAAASKQSRGKPRGS